MNEAKHTQGPLTAADLNVGRTYRAKRPAPVGAGINRLVNDRTIRWIGAGQVQYDGPSVRFGAHFPRVSIETFLAWVARDVTDELPDGEYAEWPIRAAHATDSRQPTDQP